MNHTPDHILEIARTLAHEAAAAVMSFHKKDFQKDTKADKSIVTEADLKSDQILREGLKAAFPEFGMVTEETGLVNNPDSEYVWLIDPLDGTKAFAKGIPGFSIMVGLLKQGQPYLGVVVDPLEHRSYEAVQGHGAYLISHGKREHLKVSERADYTEMRLVVSTGFPEIPLERLQEDLSGPLCEPINSVGIKVGHLVRQEADIYVNHHPVHLWDTCAPKIILEEAGGCFTKLDGTALTYELSPPFSHQALTLATNQQRHDDIVAMCAAKKLLTHPR